MPETRAEKAQRLVDEGLVMQLRPKSWGFEALVIGGHDEYITTLFNNGHYECTCEYGHFHSHTPDLCAHALAVKMVVEKENKP